MIKFTDKGKVKMDRADFDDLSRRAGERDHIKNEVDDLKARLNLTNEEAEYWRAKATADTPPCDDLYLQLDECDRMQANLEVLCAAIGDEVWVRSDGGNYEAIVNQSVASYYCVNGKLWETGSSGTVDEKEPWGFTRLYVSNEEED